jgi:hypothetical protein
VVAVSANTPQCSSSMIACSPSIVVDSVFSGFAGQPRSCAFVLRLLPTNLFSVAFVGPANGNAR